MDTLYTILRVAGTIGIVVFCFSVCISLEAIARQLKRLADSRTAPESPAAESSRPS
jgi:hypothetical protein